MSAAPTLSNVTGRPVMLWHLHSQPRFKCTRRTEGPARGSCPLELGCCSKPTPKYPWAVVPA